jgi:UDP-N-acetylmuramoyl-L-alanyl-D-glutamate--2,6-diaminopimelate ligase
MMNCDPAKTGGADLRKLFPKARFVGCTDIKCTSVTADSRHCRPGDVFVAISGSARDGHQFVADAIERGAHAIIAERVVPTGDVPLCVVRDSRAVYGRLCHELADHPSRDLKVIGVTGTNGKTTTTCLIHSIFRMAGYQSGIMGTLGYCDGIRTAPAPLTTPSAPALATYLQRMVTAGCSHAVLEMSSHALAQRRTTGIELDTACITNVAHDHLDYHSTLRNYGRAKARIFRQLRPESLTVLNVDDAVCRSYLRRLSGPVLTVGLQRPAELNATVIERFPSEQTFLLKCGSDVIPVRTRMIGDHHVYNCLLAAATGLAHGIDLATIVRGLEVIDEVPGRMQRIECGQPFSVFVDYAHSPDALRASLTALREVCQGRLICLFGAGGQRDRGKRPLMGAVVSQTADVAVITDDNPREEEWMVMARR